MTTHILLTADELFALPDDGMRHELVRGELRTMTPAGFDHGAIVMNLASVVGPFVKRHDLGVASGAETGFRLSANPDTLRAPDLGFVSRERIPESGRPTGFFPGAPDLAAEVVSPSDSYEEVTEKVLAWLRAGARRVWVLNPRTRTIAVHTPGADVRMLGERDTLDGGDVLPGFACPVAELFA